MPTHLLLMPTHPLLTPMHPLLMPTHPLLMPPLPDLTPKSLRLLVSGLTRKLRVVTETAKTPKPAMVMAPSPEESSKSSGGRRIGVSGTWVLPLVLVLGVVFVGFLDI
uniref:Uncharacterized protein n=1 Tax=Phaseolus vulgaris TaxID=3885 RepID=V7BW24_PHAVU|nr:hypothetical protein PHAVU_005G136100g [Phaseolus vulgaris]ESW22207.1 hypothetical protein PHAVU_005G136100g [Phaseolus vulgaris]